MNLRDSSAITLARRKVRRTRARVDALEKEINSLWARRNDVSQEHCAAKGKRLAEELGRANAAWVDALDDFFVVTHKENGIDAYEESDDEMGDLLSLSVGGVR